MSPKFIAAAFTVCSNFVVLFVLVLAIKILPDSPFQQMRSLMSFGTLANYMKFIFYFVPVDKILAVMEVWVVCIVNYWYFEFVLKIASGASSIFSGPVGGGN